MKRLLLTSTIFFLLLGAVAVPASAQDTLEGSWKAERDGRRTSLQLEYSDHRGRTEFSFSLRADDLTDLGSGRSELRREAGTFTLSGERSGSFVFTSSPDFVRGLESRGYEAPSVRELFQLVSLDLTLGYIDRMKSLGLSLVQLIEMKIHGVSADYVRELAGLGYSTPQLIELHIHGVGSDYVRELVEVDFEDLSARQLIEMKIHGVDPSDVRKIAEVGLSDLSSRQLIEFQIHGVRPSFIRKMAELGYRDLSAREFIEMKIHGVSPSFVRRLEEKGYRDLSARELVEMKIHGMPHRGRR